VVLEAYSARCLMDDSGRVSRSRPPLGMRLSTVHRELTSRSYLILPGLYAKDASQLKLSQAVLSVFVVALLTAGYSFTALLCFACRNETFQAEGVFLYALPFTAVLQSTC
jgi:hypothetical protein